MSYILDALKRAEAERDRGAVPTLSTQALPAERGATPHRGRFTLYAVIGAAVLLMALAMLALHWMAPRQAVVMAPAAPARAAPPPLPVQQARPEALPTPVPAPVAARSPAPAASAPIVALADLPGQVRRELPALKAGGAMVSDVPANRMLIINGQLLHEGDAVAPGLLLETIGLRAAVLSYKGQRFTISY